MSRPVVRILFVCASLVAAPASAQAPFPLTSFGLELRGELAVPTGSLADELSLDVGYGFGVTGKYWIARPLAAYLGWDRFAFGGSTPDAAYDLVDSGFRFGLQAHLPPTGRFSPFLVGGLFHSRTRLEREDSLGTARASASRRTGFEAGGGLVFPLARGLWLVPEARFRSHPAEFVGIPAVAGERTVSYVGINLGLVLRLAGQDEPPRP